MRRHPPSNNSRGPARPNPLLLCGLALLLFALWRVYSAHGDLHELHESLNKPPGAAAARPPADVQVGGARPWSWLGCVQPTNNSGSHCAFLLLLLLLLQVIMQEDEDVLFRNATSKPLNVILVRHTSACASALAPQSRCAAS